MAKTPLKIIAEKEEALKIKQNQLSEVIDRLFSQFITAITPIAAASVMPSGIFSLDKLPLLNNKIDALLSQLTRNITFVIESGITDSWQIANRGNNLIADIRLDKSLIPQGAKVTFYDTNKPALDAFIKRKEEGLGLSDRVYNANQQYKSELEAGIGVGISKGQSAAEMGRDLRQYLNNPDALFRRVRDEEGNLQLSKNAKAFKPGKGVYRSARKNIERLTISETNAALRKSDNLRYQAMPFVIGYEVRLSNRHVQCDLCDAMVGEYPVDFIFIGWHPHCLCFVVPVLMTTDQFKEYQKLVLSGNDTPEAMDKIAARIKSIPQGATDWMETNKEALGRLKTPPYWYQQNPDYVPELPQPTE
jgi:hypothetical protein